MNTRKDTGKGKAVPDGLPMPRMPMAFADAAALNSYFFWFGAQNNVDFEGVLVTRMSDNNPGIKLFLTPKLAADFLRACDTDADGVTMLTLHNILITFPGTDRHSLIQDQQDRSFVGPSIRQVVPVLDTMQAWSEWDFLHFAAPDGPIN